jgi:hypothetical protein
MGKSGKKPILCVDFDGVLHMYLSGWTSADYIADGPVPGAMDFLNRAVATFEVVVYSSRSNQPGGINAMQDWLALHLKTRFGLAKAKEILSQIGWPDCKPSAKVTLDDRAVCFDGSFPSIEKLMLFQPWNEHLKVKRA